MAEFDPDEFVGSIDKDSLRVSLPSKTIFLCGGKLEVEPNPPQSLRDAFFRQLRLSPRDYRVILAEEAEPLSPDGLYDDLFRFESDFAQIVSLIVLFVESAGSLAEFGAFAALEPVAARLLPAVKDHYYNQKSFIKDGPVRFLETNHGDEAVLILESGHLGLPANSDTLEGLDAPRLHAIVSEVVEERLAAQPTSSRFDAKIPGHIMLLLTGLCQEYGALLKKEIRQYIKELCNLPDEDEYLREKRINNFIYCVCLVGWIVKIKKGNNTYYVSTGNGAAIDYKFKHDVKLKDKLRWRTDIRDHWRTQEGARSRAISEGLKEAAK